MTAAIVDRSATYDKFTDSSSVRTSVSLTGEAPPPGAVAKSPFTNPPQPTSRNWNGRKVSACCILVIACSVIVIWTGLFGLVGIGACAIETNDRVNNCYYNHPHIDINATSFNATNYNGTIPHNVHCSARWNRYFSSCIPVGLSVSVIVSWCGLFFLTYAMLYAYVAATNPGALPRSDSIPSRTPNIPLGRIR